MRCRLTIASLAFATSLSACSGSAVQSSIAPAVSTPVNPATQTTLKFAVGTANIAGTHGLNTLETFRQSIGASAGASILVNAPTITGPTGFVVPATKDAGGDAGKHTISGTIQTSLVNPPAPSTFNPSGGIASIASAYGFLPSANTNSNTVENLIPAAMPYYASASGLTAYEYIGGPPAFTPPGHTSTQDGTFTVNNAPGSYPGYSRRADRDHEQRDLRNHNGHRLRSPRVDVPCNMGSRADIYTRRDRGRNDRNRLRRRRRYH
jgi:hypothetical protein